MDDAKSTDVAEDSHAACHRQVADLDAKYKRALADYQNREKELAREREEFARWCTAETIRDFLGIADAVDAALSSRHPERSESETNGIEGLHTTDAAGLGALRKLCTDFLKRHGVEPIGAVGARVDYLLHEVVGTRQETVHVPGTVLEVVQAGYTMHRRLLRPAKVIVCEGE